MKTLDKEGKAVIELTVEWQNGGVHYTDSLWADPVNLWRDYLLPDLATALAGKNQGDTVTIPVPKNSFHAPYQTNRLVQVGGDQVYHPERHQETLELEYGRYYPQGYLHGVTGVFSDTFSPARYLGQEKEHLLFDLNHPLAGHNLSLSAFIVEIYDTQVERGGRCEDWLEKLCADGPGMQARYHGQAPDFFASQPFERSDESSDTQFYQVQRMVHHLDSTARTAITKQYGRNITPGSRVLDLMGSWESHLPQNLVLQQLTVLGMNKEELAANTRATERVMHDLNQNPALPFADNSFDAIVCTASIEYLINPLLVFQEIHRVLQPGGVLVLAFSNRWFPPKAIKIWTRIHEFERLAMVLEMFHKTPGFQDLVALSRRGLPRPDDDPHWELPFSDPVYMAWGRKK